MNDRALSRQKATGFLDSSEERILLPYVVYLGHFQLWVPLGRKPVPELRFCAHAAAWSWARRGMRTSLSLPVLPHRLRRDPRGVRAPAVQGGGQGRGRGRAGTGPKEAPVECEGKPVWCGFPGETQQSMGMGTTVPFPGACDVPGAVPTPYTASLNLISGLLKKELLLSPLSWNSDLVGLRPLCCHQGGRTPLRRGKRGNRAREPTWDGP